jgi:DNA-binding NarL/FixJ family response regulator
MRQLAMCADDDAVQQYLVANFASLQLIDCSQKALENNLTNLHNLLVLMHVYDLKKQLNSLIFLIESGADVAVLVETPNAKEGVDLFRQGAKGYLELYADAGLLRRAIDVIQQGRVWLGQDVMSALIERVNSINKPVKTKVYDWKQGLTLREIEVGRAILKGKSNKQIADDLFISERTVKAHVRSLFEKKHVKDRLDFVIKVNDTP